MGARCFTVRTFGCQMNVHDSERIGEVLVSAGWAQTDDEAHADLIVLNTCSVREKAEQKLRSLVGTLRPARARGAIIAVAGCVAQQEGERLLATMRHVDVVIGPDNIAELPALVADAEVGAPPVVRTTFDLDEPRFLRVAPTGHVAPATAFVTTMKGCDERCSFCVVPYTRGPERYRPSDEIITEIASLVARGTREVTLLGQTVNSYRDPSSSTSRDPTHGHGSSEGESEFAALLFRIAREAPALARLRYTSPHPRHVGDELVRAHAELSVLVDHIHLPVQSGSDRMLKRMIRRYTRREYLERLGRLRAVRPQSSVTTDVIVGFPGETRADFDETLSLVREVGYAQCFGFKFSRRPLTPALRLDDDVSEEEKSARLTELFEVQETLTRESLAALVGTRQEVLVEGFSGTGADAPESPRQITGRTRRHEIVHVTVSPDAPDLTGALVTVHVARANKHSLVGELERLSAPRPDATVTPVARRRTRLPVVSV
ncbi:MAG: tRNA (N6-isopentenyl adenosine(37)-C2)-methylthiotransferase MiaB [Deltaproteobacteria bacterium]|nr:tRNA (N6-isopentenyl adenosine(37)-C2)-methylthiotransferase MiaB [Deltaproteobacteria bacterium]